jgi:glycosyltransferase involved in cell wall biosynthesis
MPDGRRILLFNPSYPPVKCGVGDYTRGLAEALADAGHEVTVVTSSAVPSSPGTNPRVLGLLKEWDIRGFLRALPRVFTPRPEVVVSSFPAVVPGRYSRLLYLVPGLARVFLRRPRTVMIVHEFVRTGDAERARLGLALRAADTIIAVTEAERDGIVGKYPSVAARVIVRHNPATLPVVGDDPRADAEVRTSLGPAERPVVGFIGLIWAAGKGFEDLLEAVARSDALLAATGTLDPSNEYHAHLTARIEQLGLGERVCWMGTLSAEQAARFLRSVDAVALPYQGGAESGYTTLLGALINGAAVITTRGPQQPDWLRDGETALLVEPRDPAGLATAIERLRSEPELAEHVRAGARSLSFGWERLVAAVADRAASD